MDFFIILKMFSTLCLMLAVSCIGTSYSAAVEHSSSAEDFEFLLLAQFWPMSSCIYFSERHVKCNLPKYIKGWTIHGLWPSSTGDQQPEFCNNSMKFDLSQIKSLESQLEVNWHYYNASAGPSDLWSHEWEKHGTCAYPLETLKGEMNYFSRTLQLHSKLNTFEALASSEIEPSNTKTYSRDDFLNAVVKYYKFKPNIVCDYDHRTQKTYIDQIYLCYDKTLEPRDCTYVPHTSSYFDKCEEQDQIYYLSLGNEGLEHQSKSLIFRPEHRNSN